MKYLNRIVWSIGALAVFTACVDLDTYPEGDTVMANQKDASMIRSDMNGFNAILNFTDVDNNGYHFDFGIPSVYMIMDAAGPDVPCVASNNQMAGPQGYTNRTYTSAFAYLPWSTYYKYIANSNAIIGTMKNAAESKERNAYYGYALAARAWAYSELIQAYALNYAIIDPDTEPGVPIVTEDTPADQINNNPRATVQAVYDLIMDDLDAAIEMLDDAVARPNKSFIDLAVAYGIRARVNLAMHNYAAAAADAKAAQTNSNTTLLSRQAVSVPGFNSADIASVMWAVLVPERSRVVTTGIINWPGFLCSFDLSNGYATGKPSRSINQPLWDVIPMSDVRKGWWVDENLSSPLSDGLTAPDGTPMAKKQNWEPYVNVKFHDYQNIIVNGGKNASDWIMMRREEMLLIEAEGLAMSGDLAGGKAILEGWVKANRNSDYVSVATSAADFQDEVWFQRRIELWSEGRGWFDIMRLNKNVVRVPRDGYSTFLETNQFNVAAEMPLRAI